MLQTGFKIREVSQDCYVEFSEFEQLAKEGLDSSLLTDSFTVSTRLAIAHSKLPETASFDMATQISEAEKKFWETRELVEMLLPFLDPESTLNLAQNQDKVPGVLQGPLIWYQFIRRASPFTDEGIGLLRRDRREQMNIDAVKCLVAILKLMKNPNDPRVDLLELICEKYPTEEQGGFLHLACSSHSEGHRISPEGFLLLEEVESAFSSTEMKIEMIDTESGYWNNPVWSAISTRLARCRDTMTSVRIIDVALDDVTTMKAIRTVLQFCPAHSTYLETMTVTLKNLAMIEEFRNLLLFCPDHIPKDPLHLLVNGDIGNEDWESLAKSVQLRPGFVEQVACCHHVLQEAKKEDMRVIWEVVGDVELVHDIWNENFSRRDGERGWRRLSLVMDMTEEELNREFEEEIKNLGY